MSLRSLNARLAVHDAMKKVNYKTSLIPLAPQLIRSVKCAYSRYYRAHQEKLQIEEEIKKAKEIQDKEAIKKEEERVRK